MKYSVVLLVSLYLFWVILDTEFLFLKKNTICVFWKKSWMLKFLRGCQLLSQHWICYILPKNLHGDFCLYIFEGLLKKREKEKDNCLIFEIKKTNKKAFSKIQSFREDNRISSENFWKYFANLLSCKKIFMVRTFLFWGFFGLIFFFYYGL